MKPLHVFCFSVFLALAGVATTVRAQLMGTPSAPQSPAVRTAEEQAIDREVSIPKLLELGRKYEAQGDWKRYAVTMARILKLRPHAGNIKLELAAAYAMQDLKSEGYETLLYLKEAGYGADLAADARLNNLHGTEVWTYLAEGFAQNKKPKTTGHLAYTLEGGDWLVDAVTWDAKQQRLLVGSTRTGEVFQVGPQGALKAVVRPTAKNGLWGVTALLADSERDALWVASAAGAVVKHAKAADYGKAALFRFRLSDGEFLHRYDPPPRAAIALDSLALAPNGDVYAADSVARAIFRVDASGMRTVAQNPRLTSVSGLAVSGDHKYLYFSDFELGLFAIDLSTQKPLEIKVAKTVNLFGVDNLYWQPGYLIATQPGFVPARVVRFKLTGDGQGIIGAETLDSAQPDWGIMAQGALAGDQLYFVANMQKDAYDLYGVLDKAKLERTRIWVTPITEPQSPPARQ